MRTRFAPSPTGPLHLGHAFSALTAWDLARAAGGDFVLRIEDIDAGRCRPEHEAAIRDDLAWLGLRWPEPALRQSARLPAYREALERLAARGLIYPCACTRADIAAALSAPQEGASGPDGPVYSGACRGRAVAAEGAAWRLDMAAAIADLGGPAAVAGLRCRDTGPEGRAFGLDPAALIDEIGDVVLARRDIGASYHLAVVLDDAHQGITDVVRGCDLAAAVPLHRLLQALLGLPAPAWRHHALIRDADGRRLAKRDRALALAVLRDRGWAPADIRRELGLGAGF